MEMLTKSATDDGLLGQLVGHLVAIKLSIFRMIVYSDDKQLFVY